MKRSRFSEEQIIGILQEHQSVNFIKDICRCHGISEVTFYRWRSRYGGMEASEAKCLRALEAENTRLKRLLAESVMMYRPCGRCCQKTSNAQFTA